MKTNRFKYPGFIYFFFASMIIFSSCQEKVNVDKPNNIKYDTINIVDIYHLDNDSTKPSCSLQINYIAPIGFDNKEVLAKVQNELNYVFFENEGLAALPPKEASEKFAELYIKNYKKDIDSLIPAWDETHESADYYSYYKKLNSEILFDQGNILSYQAKTWDYRGGANSTTYYINFVFDLKTGKRLYNEDILKDGYYKILSQLMVDDILKQNDAKDIEELRLINGYFGIEELPDNSNFSVDSKGLTYIFNSSEIAPPTVGATKVFIPFESLFMILKDNSPISHLYQKQ